MLPKICYFLFYLFLTLVAATPVALEDRAPKPAPSPVSLGLKVQTIDDLNKPAKGKKNPFVEYSSILSFKDGSKITNDHVVGLAKAAWMEMYNMHLEANKKKVNKATLPTVMSAMKVGNEVYLASSMKGGGGRYIYVAREETDDGKTTDKGKDTDKGKKTDKGKDADKGKKTDKGKDADKGKKTDKGKDSDKGKKTDKDKAEDKYGEFTSVLKDNAEDVMQALKDVSTQSQGHKNGQGAANSNGGTVTQHRTQAGCGEVMVSLEYRLEHKHDKLRKTQYEQDKKKHKPTIVAWEGLQNGKLINGGGKIKAPCGKVPETQDDDACGENWGCAAFTGPPGMDFEVISAASPKDPSAEDFPTFTHKNVVFPTPAKIDKK
ncbi:hypothetical protein ABOM_009906 [Aspergillus bombycis]|uniref:Uncharacterized protein n=1 Tax=Aspergillus bombycis TaxID=109264 RepID=A0A1F7ZQL2_9EURO|nr:hypothetical protein ABOM_009906 [Aspergillus bombycis]OGM41707.1 hypothetical protein ABOM_009906 [Aspergillus bombycis]